MPDAGWERIGRRVVAWSLLVIAITVTYCWCVRISNDLNWDEAGSLRRYAHHPLTSAAYIHDSNNHPLDSFFRSVFFSVLGLDWPPFWRFAGFVILLGFLAVSWRWHAELAGRDSIFAATLAVLLLFLSHVIHEQALVLRGYFPTIVLEAVYLLLVARWSRLLDPTVSEAERPVMTRRRRTGLAALSAVMMFFLPSNLVLMLVLWPAATMAFRVEVRPGGNRLPAILREITKLGLLSGAFTTVLYLPILATLAAGISTIQTSSLPVYPVPSIPGAIFDEIVLQLRHVQPGLFFEEVGRPAPGALPEWIYWPLLGALLLASVLFRRRARGTQVAWCLILTTLGVNAIIAAFNDTPARIKSPYVAPILFAMVFLAHDLAGRWRQSTQVAAALVAIVLGASTLPATVRATQFDRRGSDLAVFLETYTRPAERHVLVLHANAQTLRPYLHRVFGDAWTIDSMAELKERLSGVKPKPAREIGSVERWVTSRIKPDEDLPPIKPDDVDVLVVISQKADTSQGAVTWNDPTLDAIKQRLSKVSRFRRDARDLDIYEKP